MRLEEEILQDRFQSECHRAILNIFYTYHWLVERLRTILKPFGITMQQYNILRILRGQQRQPIGIQEIQQRMLDKSSDVSRLVDRLVRRKLVTRTESQADRRRKEVAITEQGLQLLERLDPQIQAMDRVCRRLSDREVQLLNELLDKLRG